MKTKKSMEEWTKIHINQDKNDAFLGIGDVVRGRFSNGEKFGGEITCIETKKEGNALHPVMDLKYKNEDGEPLQASC